MTSPRREAAPDDLIAAHTPERVRERLEEPIQHSYLRDFVYGAIDGAVTSFAIVSAVAGAGLSTGVILVLGLANLIGDGFSMAASNFLGTKTDQELRDKARRTEDQHITLHPAGEREEIRQIFAQKGFAGQELERVVDVITADRGRWIDTMLVEELRLPLEGPAPLRAATTTLGAFVLIGSIPLLPFWIGWLTPWTLGDPYVASIAMTGAAFAVVGAAKSRFVDESAIRAAVETLLVGGGAAGIAYGIGLLLRSQFPEIVM